MLNISKCQDAPPPHPPSHPASPRCTSVEALELPRPVFSNCLSWWNLGLSRVYTFFLWCSRDFFFSMASSFFFGFPDFFLWLSVFSRFFIGISMFFPTKPVELTASNQKDQGRELGLAIGLTSPQRNPGNLEAQTYIIWSGTPEIWSKSFSNRCATLHIPLWFQASLCNKN